MSTDSECVPAVCTKGKKAGQLVRGGNITRTIRAELTKRDGPPSFPKALCRHLCKNDSTAPNGFVCTLHTVWGTKSENERDKSKEVKKISVSIERTCPYCGRTIRGPSYFTWHGDRCKHKPEGEADENR